jgi:hypothetical protein
VWRGITRQAIEFLVKPPLERFLASEEDRNIVYRTILAAGRVLLALGFSVDAMALFGLKGVFPWFGAVVTGLLLGRRANWIHEFVRRWVEPIRYV